MWRLMDVESNVATVTPEPGEATALRTFVYPLRQRYHCRDIAPGLSFQEPLELSVSHDDITVVGYLRHIVNVTAAARHLRHSYL